MKGLGATLVAAVVLAIGGWYYFAHFHSTAIGKVVSNPRDYAGKEIVVSGTVTDRFSLIIIKYFNLRDSSGMIPVVTDRPLPAVGAKIRVKGYVKEEFSLGDRQVLVFQESASPAAR
jgi:hypothetical protein